MMRRLAPALPILAIALALFLALFDPATLDIGNAGWLLRGTDNGENALGLHAYLHDRSAGASLRTGLLNAPEGVPILFTDSNPLLGLLLRPIASLLPADAQFVGPWLLLCLILQALFAWLALRRFAPGPLALWAGVVLLAALPTLFNRFVHANLFAHWLILAALCLFLDAGRATKARWWLPLIGATAMIHNYLLVMVAAIWATAMIERAVNGDRLARLLVAMQVVAVAGMVAVLAWWMGATGRFAAAGNYGAFAMPIDALVNPSNPSFSTLLPATPQRPGRGFEGFQYLGAGLILALPIAGLVALKVLRGDVERRLHRRLTWLVPALVVLAALAITNYPELAGRPLPRFALPALLAPALDMVRASGRLFWPVAYVVVMLAVVAIYRLGARKAGYLLVALATVQAIDLANMFVAIRSTTAEAAQHRLYVRTADPRWGIYVARAHDVAFEPAEPTQDLALFQELAWRAASLGRPVRTVYAARTPIASAVRQRAEHADYRAGRIDPRRLYVLLPLASVPAGAEARLRVIDGVRVLAPAQRR